MLQWICSYYFMLVFNFGQEVCEILAPRPGIEPTLTALKGEVLTTGKSPGFLILKQSSVIYREWEERTRRETSKGKEELVFPGLCKAIIKIEDFTLRESCWSLKRWLRPLWKRCWGSVGDESWGSGSLWAWGEDGLDKDINSWQGEKPYVIGIGMDGVLWLGFGKLVFTVIPGILSNRRG